MKAIQVLIRDATKPWTVLAAVTVVVHAIAILLFFMRGPLPMIMVDTPVLWIIRFFIACARSDYSGAADGLAQGSAIFWDHGIWQLCADGDSRPPSISKGIFLTQYYLFFDILQQLSQATTVGFVLTLVLVVTGNRNRKVLRS